MDNLIPLGVSLLSACLKEAGHEVKLFDTTFYKTRERTGDEARIETLQVKHTNLADFGILPKDSDVISDFKKLVKEFKPDLIGVSVVEPTYLIGLKLLNTIKGSGIPTIMGGIHVTFSPEDVINEPAINMICVGEGEKAIVELANCLRDKINYKDIPNIWVKEDGRIYQNTIRPLTNLDELPEQDWDIYEKQRFYKPMGGKISITGAIELNRGCPYNCAFCCNKRLQDIYNSHGRYYRQRSIDNFINEVKAKKAKYGLQYLYIVAENFLLMEEKRFNEFIDRFKEIKLPFWVQARPDVIIEERLLKLRDIGCEGLSIGVEHGNEEFRKNILERNLSDETIKKAFNIAKKVKIRTSANNIIGFPTETRELIFDTIELNRSINADDIIINIFAPYRGTKLRQLCVEKGYLDSSAIAGDYRFDIDLNMPYLPPDQIRGLQRTFAMYVRFPKSRWPEIEKCEKLDQEGNNVFENMRKEYVSTYM